MGLICSFLLFLKIQLTISACHLLIKVASPPATYHLRYAPDNIMWKIFWTLNEIKTRLWDLTNALLTHLTYTPLSSFPKARRCRRGGLRREKLSSVHWRRRLGIWYAVQCSAVQNFVSFCKFTDFRIYISGSVCKLRTCKSKVVLDGCVRKRNLEFLASEFGYPWVFWMWECRRQWFWRWKSISQCVCVFFFISWHFMIRNMVRTRGGGSSNVDCLTNCICKNKTRCSQYFNCKWGVWRKYWTRISGNWWWRLGLVDKSLLINYEDHVARQLWDGLVSSEH